MTKPRLHILNTEKTMGMVTIVESTPVREIFDVTKSPTIPRDADLVFTQTYGASDVIHVLQLSDKPYVIHMGGDPWHELAELPNRLNAVRHLLSRAKAVVANSSFLYKIVRANGIENSLFLPGGLWGFDETAIGIDPKRFKKKQTYRVNAPFTLLMAISLTVSRKYRGIDAFMRRAQPFLKGKDVRVVCAGTIRDCHFAERMQVKYGVEFLGKLEDWPGFLPTADLFVHPSLFDCFPRALAEAKCAGLPCLSFDAAGNRTVGEAPVYIDPTDGDTLCGSLETLYREEGLREYLGHIGRENALRKTEQHRWDYAALLAVILHGGLDELVQSAFNAVQEKEVLP